MKQHIRGALIFLLISLILSALIGVGLPRLKLQPGMPLPSLEQGQLVAPRVDAPPAGMRVNAFAGTLALIILAAFMLFLIIQSARGIPWKRLLARMRAFVWKILLVAAVLVLVLALLPRPHGTISAQPLPAPRPLATAPLGPVPSVLIWIVGTAIAGAVLFLGFRIILAKRTPVGGSLEREVEKARQALLDGQDLRTVILQCYRRMGQVLQQEQKIERASFMTAGEFEDLLTARGVPHGPVHQLTRLFEAVRYGHWEPAAGDEKGALRCLDAVLLYSRRTGREG